MPPSTSQVKDSKVKVSNLPLLFVRGLPTSLECMRMEELQRFLRFVLKCELNLSAAPNLDKMEQPAWWPPDLAFSEATLTQRQHRGKLSIQLREAIKLCYGYHSCLFLIDFSRKVLAYAGGIENLQVVDNMNGTRSLVKKQDSKLLVTFRSENQDYDLNLEGQETPKLFSARTPLKLADTRRLAEIKCENSSDPALARVEEIFLCDHCDQDFNSLTHLMSHETRCGKEKDVPSSSRSPPTLHNPGYAHQLFAYLRLGRPDRKNPPERRKQRSVEMPRETNYETFMDIPISSPMGSYLIKSYGLGLDQQNPALRGYVSQSEYLAAVEARCPGTMKALRCSNAWIPSRDKFLLTYRTSRQGKGVEWCHLYCFTAEQQLARLTDINNGLSSRAFRLWKRTRAKSINVRLKRLPDVLVSRAASNKNTIQVSSLCDLLAPGQLSSPGQLSFPGLLSSPGQLSSPRQLSSPGQLLARGQLSPPGQLLAPGQLPSPGQLLDGPAYPPSLPHLNGFSSPCQPTGIDFGCGETLLSELKGQRGGSRGPRAAGSTSPPFLQLRTLIENVITLSDSEEEEDGNDIVSWTAPTVRPGPLHNPSAEFRPGPNHPQKTNQRHANMHISVRSLDPDFQAISILEIPLPSLQQKPEDPSSGNKWVSGLSLRQEVECVDLLSDDE